MTRAQRLLAPALLVLGAAAAPAGAQTVISSGGGSITTDKNGNVHIKGAGGDSINTAGKRTSINGGARTRRAGATGATGATGGVVVNGNGARRTVACNGGAVTVNGNHNQLTLRGACPSVTVIGNSNTLAVDSAGAITTPGNGNRVTFAAGIGGRAPGVSNVGSHNTVGPAQ